jgi:WXG100 family type VII secretion target
LVRGALESALSEIVKNAGFVSDARDRLKTYVQVIKGSWIGGDEEAFEQEVNTVLLPMVEDFIKALMGINTNTHKAMDLMDAGDAQAKAAIGRLKGTFQGI